MHHGLDNTLYFDLPESVNVEFTPAGIMVRSCAYLYDFLLRSIIVGVCAGILVFFKESGIGLIFIIYFLVSWGYYIYFESKGGKTPGKKKFKIHVVQDNGLPASFSHIVIRNLLRSADAFPFAYVFALITMSVGKDFKRIGDWAAGTLVVHDSEFFKTDIQSDLKMKAPEFSLSSHEQQLVIAYYQRSVELSKARQIELANILCIQLKVEDDQAREKLQQIALYYLGQDI